MEPGWRIWAPQEPRDGIFGVGGEGGSQADGLSAKPEEDVGTSACFAPVSPMVRASALVASTLAAARSRGLLQVASSSSCGSFSLGVVLVLLATAPWRRRASTMPSDVAAEVVAFPQIAQLPDPASQQPIFPNGDRSVVVMCAACLFLVGVVVGLVVGCLASLKTRGETPRSQCIQLGATSSQSVDMIEPKALEESKVADDSDSDMESYYIGTPHRENSILEPVACAAG